MVDHNHHFMHRFLALIDYIELPKLVWLHFIMFCFEQEMYDALSEDEKLLFNDLKHWALTGKHEPRTYIMTYSIESCALLEIYNFIFDGSNAAQQVCDIICYTDSTETEDLVNKLKELVDNLTPFEKTMYTVDTTDLDILVDEIKKEKMTWLSRNLAKAWSFFSKLKSRLLSGGTQE